MKITNQPTIQLFIDAVQNGVNEWEKAGKILVELKSKDEGIFHKINAAHKFISLETLHQFYDIGIRAVFPMALLLPRHVAAEVLTMSYETQKRVIENHVEVVQSMVKQNPIIKVKSITDLTKKEAKQCLNSKGIISVEKQTKAMLPKSIIAPEPIVRKPTPQELVRKPTSKGLFIIRRMPSGNFAFEKTTARTYNVQNIRLEAGTAIVELLEYTNTIQGSY